MQFDIEERFGQELRKALVKRFGKVPSAAFVAIRFNQLETLEKTVSGECVRRWIRGAAMPSYDHLSLLASWLSIDLDDTIKRQTGCPPAPQMGAFDHFFSRLASDMQHQMRQVCGSCSTYDVRLSLDFICLTPAAHFFCDATRLPRNRCIPAVETTVDLSL
jgi:hypothetical protein